MATSSSRRPTRTPSPAPSRARKPGKRTSSPAPPAVDDGESVVVYIHGIGRHLPKDDLKLEWDLALFGRGRGAATRMAYWSDLVHPPSSRTASAAADANLETDAILAAAGVPRRSAAARAYVEALRRRYGFEVVPGGRGLRAKVLPLPGFLREPIARAFLKAFVADTAAYFFDDAKRRAIRRRLEDVLPAGPTPVTLVAHSQGSIVALEVLSRRRDLTLAKLVTIGSPLGLQEVQDQLAVPPGHKPFEVPPCVGQWDNFADPLDPVALDKRLAEEFVLSPLSHDAPRLQVPIVDRLIVNTNTTRFRGFNPHSAVGYLAHPEVRRSVYEATHFDPIARFVVARDVSEALGHEARHPVLIEVLEPGYSALDESEDECRTREAKAGRTLAERIAAAAADLEGLVRRTAVAGRAPARAVTAEVEAARIEPLRRFVAAHLNPAELRHVAQEHRHFNVYAVWRSASKRKLLHRSRAVLQADAAFESYHATGARIRWAVLDTGIRSDHPHFNEDGRSRIAAIWDCTRPGPPRRLARDTDPDGHGSHVAGIIAGRGSDGRRTYQGMAPEAELVVYKVLDDRGEGEDAWIIKALDHIAAQNENHAHMAIHGLNLSLGGPYDSTVYGCGFTPICQELRRLWRSGVVVVVASGNEGQIDVQTRDGEVELNTLMSIGDPANLEDCIAVGSVNADRPHLYGVSAFSSRGPTSDGRCKPDVVAPGERITSVNAAFTGDARRYRAESGTSMAAPHVSGLVAAFLSVRREFIGRPDEIKKLMMDTCTDLGRDKQHQGRGIPNLMKMLLNV
jgi:subtilisin family serine protease